MAAGDPVQRRLAAILAADVAGYSRLMGADEEETLARLKELRRELIDPAIAAHRGRIVHTAGDGLLVEFASVVDAMRCAIQWQDGARTRNGPVPQDRRIDWRIGVNLGDILIDDDDIHGDGVNIAARLEAIAETGGICISHTVLNHTRGKLEFPVEDLGEQMLKNIARPVHVFRVLGEEKKMPGPATLPLPDKPSIAVLPFQNMSGDPEQDYFADGMVEEIITALSRIRWLFVIARNSSFTYKGQMVDVKRVGRELGVRYVLEGSVRKGGSRVRITAQLIEAETGAHLWADRFDGSLEDIFDLQDQVATSVAGVLDPALQAAETERVAHRPTSEVTAYDAYLRAYAMMFASGKRVPEALALLDGAIARDPSYGLALAWAAVCCMRLWIDGSTKDADADRRKGVDYARRALQRAGEDPAVLANAALPLAFFGEDIGATIRLVDHALALNPSYARGWYIKGLLSMWAGEPESAIEQAETSIRLSPRGGIGTVHALIANSLFMARRFEEAVPKFLFAIQDEPDFAMAYRFLAACYAHLGRLDEARATLVRLRAVSPIAMPKSLNQFRRPEDRALLISGLRLAIGEEGSSG